MFNFAWSEILLIAAVALIVIGPKDLPIALRAVAKIIKKARHLAHEFQQQFDEMLRASEVDKVKEHFDDITHLPPISVEQTRQKTQPLAKSQASPVPHEYVPTRFDARSVSYDPVEETHEKKEEERAQEKQAVDLLLAQVPCEIPPQAARFMLRDRERLFTPDVIPPRFLRHGGISVRPSDFFSKNVNL